MKKKVVSMMLALTLVFSEIPAYTANAAENPSDNVENVEEDGTETSKTEEDESTQFTDTQNTEIENTDQSNVEEQNTETAQTENTEWEVKTEIKTAAAKRPINDADNELATFHVAGNGKAVGSDGVLYEDVVYLSADTVRALDEDIQSVYFEVCDSIAELKAQEDALNGAVIAVDEEGNLHYSISVPTKRLAEGSLFQERADSTEESSTQESIKESSEKTEEVYTETEAAENNSTEDRASEETESKEASTEDNSTIAESTEEVSSKEETLSSEETSKEETSVKEETSSMEEVPSAEETSNQDTSVEETTSSEEDTEQDTTESSTTEETSEEETNEEETISEEESSEEAESTEEVSSIEDTTEVDATEPETIEAEPEGYVFAPENMELLEYGQEETFEVVDNVKVEPIVDLGYGFNTGYSQFNSTLTSKTYFKDQLKDIEKKIYDAGVNKLTKGTNQFNFKYPINDIKKDLGSGLLHARVYQAASAIIMQYPYQMDWMDLSEEGDAKLEVYVWQGTENLTGDLKFTIDKSPYYNAGLVKQANTQVSKLTKEAQTYAAENYPNDIVYGVVKYFDDWICKNNYYDMIGVSGGKENDTPAQKEAYYYCHSSYGILLKGFGVCESYALAITRLLDAMSIPNMYATGIAGTPDNYGGHAWNYVGMPDAKWYLQDSTWNDDTDPSHTVSFGDYLLRADDGMHVPQGARWIIGTGDFKFVDVNTSNYVPQSQISLLEQKELSLKPKEKGQLSFHADYANLYKPTYRSSDVKVAKVDKNGKITAVSAGQATITATYNISGMGAVSDTCTVNVMQVKGLISQRTNKANDTISVGMGSPKYVTLKADCGNGIYDAEMLLKDETIGINPEIKVPKNNVADITYDREKSQGNLVVFKISPIKAGSASYKITIDKKAVTLKVSVGEIIKREWFKIDADYIVDAKTPYTGKALKPKVLKNAEASDIPSDLKFKTTYFNNKDAGTASIVVSGTGKYAGEETFEFEIESLPIDTSVITSTIKSTQSIAYNGGVNQAKATIKYKNGKTNIKLKAGVDYDIVYSNNGKETTEPKEAGTYSVVSIKGKGSFNGTVPVSGATYTIKSNSLKKAKVTFTPDNEAIVKFGKNELSSTEYTVEYYKDKNCTEKLSAKPRIKGTYYVMVRPTDASKNNLTDEKKVTLKVK